MQKIDLYIDCDGVILDTLRAARRIAKRLGYDPDDFNSLHEYFIHDVNWKDIIEEAGVIGNAVEAINGLVASGRYDVVIFTKLSRHFLAKYTSGPDEEVDYRYDIDTQVPLCYDEKNEIYKLFILRKLFPNIPILITDIKHDKSDIVDAENAILIDDALRNFRKWRECNENAVGILFSRESRENYCYDYREDALYNPISDDEAKCMIGDISELEKVEAVRELIKKLDI